MVCAVQVCHRNQLDTVEHFKPEKQSEEAIAAMAHYKDLVNKMRRPDKPAAPVSHATWPCVLLTQLFMLCETMHPRSVLTRARNCVAS